MAQKITEVMTPNPTTCPSSATVREAAELMKEQDVGNLLVEENGTVIGIVTDRDLVVRALAEGLDPRSTKLSDVCSAELVTLAPDDTVDDAVKLMREKAVRRVPVCDGGTAVGIVSIGDLAQERDPKSALADISAAPANT